MSQNLDMSPESEIAGPKLKSVGHNYMTTDKEKSLISGLLSQNVDYSIAKQILNEEGLDLIEMTKSNHGKNQPSPYAIVRIELDFDGAKLDIDVSVYEKYLQNSGIAGHIIIKIGQAIESNDGVMISIEQRTQIVKTCFKTPEQQMLESDTPPTMDISRMEKVYETDMRKLAIFLSNLVSLVTFQGDNSVNRKIDLEN